MPASALALVSDKQKPQAVAADVVVLKFGSSVLRNAAEAPAVASEIYSHVRAGRKVVAVVSALSGHTDRLLAAWNNEYACLGYGAHLYEDLKAFCELTGIRPIAL